jgi:hypothetical protein
MPELKTECHQDNARNTGWQAEEVKKLIMSAPETITFRPYPVY